MVVSGFATVTLTFWGTIHFVFPFYAHTYPFAWYGLIVFLDGLLWWRWGEGLMVARPREFITLLFWSAVFWFFFEIWNLRLQNWYYVGVPSHELWSHIEAYLDYATVLPGLFLVYRLLCRIKIPRQVKGRLALKKRASKAFPLIGAVMLALPLIWPDYFFPLVWGGLIFLLEPVCAKWGGRSLIKDAASGQWTTVVRLLLAGILCGGYWELCNYWSMEKWVYTVPLFSEGKLFEMPYLGFLGFPPFCVECFVMINALYLLRDGRHWDPEAVEGPKGNRRRHKIVYMVMIVLGLVLSEWSYAKLRARTIDSRSESIQQILEDISPLEASSLSQKGWCYPREILQNWNEVKRVIRQPFRDPIRQRLELVSLVNMGSVNARLLERAGISSLEKLRKQKPNELFPRLVRMNQTLRLRQTPLLKRRVLGWIGAAKRQSAFF
jgi:hypothetical protein